MAKLLPIYKEGGETYQADTCKPVVRAVEAGQLYYTALARGHYYGRPLAKGHLPGVKLLGLWDAKHDQGWGLESHRNEGLELTFLETGGLPFQVGQRTYRMEPDDLTVTRPWEPHQVGDPNVSASRFHFLILDLAVRQPHEPWKWPSWLVLTPADLEELTTVLRQNSQAVWHAGAEVRRCFQKIGQAVEGDVAGSSISRLAAYLNELLVLVLEVFRHHGAELNASLSSTRRTVELFWADLRENIAHLALAWTLRAMARQCGLGGTQFASHTRQLTNMPPAQLLNHYRIEAGSKLLLSQPEMSVTQIGLACGFCSGQYFSTVFRRHFGCSPREFRESHVKIEVHIA